MGKKALGKAVRRSGAMLNTQKAYGGQLTKKQLAEKYNFLPDDGKGEHYLKEKKLKCHEKTKAK